MHGEHVYQVGELGLLVHNSTPECAEALARLPGSRLIDIRNLRLDPGGRQFADPAKLALRGKFDWANYKDAIEVTVRKGVLTLVNGVTRVEMALRAGITHLPAIINHL